MKKVLLVEKRPGVDTELVADMWGRGCTVEEIMERFPDANPDTVEVEDSNGQEKDAGVIADEWLHFV